MDIRRIVLLLFLGLGMSILHVIPSISSLLCHPECSVLCAALRGCFAAPQCDTKGLAYRGTVHSFDPPIDGLSIGTETDAIDLSVSARIGGLWTAWTPLEIEKEFDPLLQESNLVLFPQPVSHVRIRGKTRAFALHPIRVSQEPVRYFLAARSPLTTPRILSRTQWGADDSLLFTGRESQRSDVNHTIAPHNGEETPDRVKECDDLQKRFPHEFTSRDRILQNPEGKSYRWPLEFSPSVHLLVVHHTALTVTGDPRPPVERIRALYEYHANSRGWGDIGYNFLIDEKGQIYEGRAGGDYVVGGHAYCNNIGSMGIALLGNFDQERPPLPQIQSLQWLLKDLAEKYDIDLESRVEFHGKTLPTIVGHRSLVSTDCPGYYVHETLDQIRRNVAKGDTNASVTFPAPLRKYVDRTDSRRMSRVSQETRAQKEQRTYGIFPIGSQKISARPGQSLAFTVRFVSEKPFQERQHLASIERSSPQFRISQDIAGARVRLRDSLLAPVSLRTNETIILPLTLRLPEREGSYLLTIDEVKYIFNVSGRRLREAIPNTLPLQRNFIEHVMVSSTNHDKNEAFPPPLPLPPASATPLRQGYEGREATAGRQGRGTTGSDIVLIRVRLSYPHGAATLASRGNITISHGFFNPHSFDKLMTGSNPLPSKGEGKNGETIVGGEFVLKKNGGGCALSHGDSIIAEGIILITPQNTVTTITSWNRAANRFRGTIECRIIDGALILINQLSLEEYLAGLAEEPDTEPYEKQRAFAIAARTYAAHYMQDTFRKFPGLPYDGSDNPAEFQAYGGVAFEEANPRWAQAVRSTSGKVLMKDGQIIRAAYFSSDDGRTRSPEERGWPNFPFAEVFVSKPDPWCRGFPMNGHGVGMSGCGAGGQAREGQPAEKILEYYYPGITINNIRF